MLTTASLATALVPSTPDLQLDDVTSGAAVVTATLRATRLEGACPLCGCRAGRIHSRYQRARADLPWSQHRVRLVLTVRKFFCEVEACRRRIFTERLPDVVVPYARRTTRLGEALRLLAFALGGEAGARFIARLGLAASPATLLRIIRRTTCPTSPSPRVLGVDDWAFRKGHRYGTILLDLETHRPVDLLPNREAETLAAWLRQHPGVEVIARDRAEAYARGARDGAPQARQIADRFHLVKNSSSALDELLAVQRRGHTFQHDTTRLSPIAQEASPLPDLHRPRRSAAHSSARVARWERVQDLYGRAVSISQIARETELDRKTVRRLVATAG
jgi:transposase